MCAAARSVYEEAMKTMFALALAASLASPALAADKPNAFSDRLKKLAPIQQKAVMRRAVLDDV